MKTKDNERHAVEDLLEEALTGPAAGLAEALQALIRGPVQTSP